MNQQTSKLLRKYARAINIEVKYIKKAFAKENNKTKAIEEMKLTIEKAGEVKNEPGS